MSQMKMSARDLIKRSLNQLGVISASENPSSSDANHAFTTLNMLVDQWNTENLLTIGDEFINIPLTGLQKYTLGESGMITGNRPMNGVKNAVYYNGSNDNLSTVVKVINAEQWRAISQNTMATDMPQVMYYNNSYPNSELYVYPQPSSGKLVITIGGQLSKFATLDTIIDLPSGYLSAIQYNLAVLLGIDFGQLNTDKIEQLAAGAKTRLKTTNSGSKMPVMRLDSALISRGGSFNIYSGG